MALISVECTQAAKRFCSFGRITGGAMNAGDTGSMMQRACGPRARAREVRVVSFRLRRCGRAPLLHTCAHARAREIIELFRL
jgi:hypothetical protein